MSIAVEISLIVAAMLIMIASTSIIVLMLIATSLIILILIIFSSTELIVEASRILFVSLRPFKWPFMFKIFRFMLLSLRLCFLRYICDCGSCSSHRNNSWIKKCGVWFLYDLEIFDMINFKKHLSNLTVIPENLIDLISATLTSKTSDIYEGHCFVDRIDLAEDTLVANLGCRNDGEFAT